MKKIVLAALVVCATTGFSQSWVQMSNAPTGRHHPVSFSLDGKGYAVTGTRANGQPTSDAYEYDPVANTWTTLSAFPGPARSFGIGVVNNGIAYLGFGAGFSNYLNDLWSYDATTNTWTELASCGCSGRRHPAMMAVGDKIYVGLGDDASGDRNDFWMYDITLNTWTQIASLPGSARHHPYMFTAAGEAFAGMGHRGSVIFKDWYKLDATNNTWTQMNDFPGEARVAGTQFSIGDKGFVLSGDGDDHSFMSTGEMWRYSPDTDEWKSLTPHPGISRWAPGSFVINNEVYFFGGQNRQTFGFPSDLWKFDLTSETVGVKEQSIKTQKVFPNPASNTIYWEYDQRITEVKVYDAVGQLLVKSNTSLSQLSLGDFKNGMYVIHFYEKGQLIASSRVLVQH